VAKIKVVNLWNRATQADPHPHWYVTVDYGGGTRIDIPLAAHYLPTDDALEQKRQSCEAMENLAKALLDFAGRIRSRWPNDRA
jgi:hypothetical protein